MSNLFSFGGLEPVCFPWASLALFLTLYFHGFLLNSLGFPGLITLSLILGAHGLAINPLLFLFSLLWACRGPFSLFHIIYCLWSAFSLFLGSFKPIYLLKAHFFISWACDPLFLPLGLNGFSIYLPNSFLSVLLGFFFPLGLPKWPSTVVYRLFHVGYMVRKRYSFWEYAKDLKNGCFLCKNWKNDRGFETRTGPYGSIRKTSNCSFLRFF